MGSGGVGKMRTMRERLNKRPGSPGFQDMPDTNNFIHGLIWGHDCKPPPRARSNLEMFPQVELGRRAQMALRSTWDEQLRWVPQTILKGREFETLCLWF